VVSVDLMLKMMIRGCVVMAVTNGYMCLVIALLQYDNMLKDPSDDPWFCSICRSASSSQPPSRPGLSCVCFIVWSIINKCLDFMAFMYAHQFDVVALTETFLELIHKSNNCTRLIKLIQIQNYIVNIKSSVILCASAVVMILSNILFLQVIITPRDSGIGLTRLRSFNHQ